MNPSDTEKFNQSIALANSGQKSDAYQQLLNLQQTYPNEPNLVLWLIFTAPTITEAETNLKALEQNDPANTNLVSARNWLANEKAKQVSTFNQVPNFAPAPPPPYTAPPPQYYQPVYQQQMPMYQPSMPRQVMSGAAVFGWYVLYFFGCLAMLIVVALIAGVVIPRYATAITPLLVLGTSIWAGVDASQRRSRFEPAAASHPAILILVCLAMWLFLFPLFLANRRKSIAYYGK